VTRREGLSKSGEIIRYNPPRVVHERQCFIVRDDGSVFGDVGNPIEAAGLDVHLPEIPPADKLWSAAGVKVYCAGGRPDPAGVFRRVADVIDRFIDFDRSLAPQEVMVEAIACYCLSTWLLDAFNVIGFLWPNGERGSGKTHLLHVVSELAYLGQLILAGGSYATLRDLADYGATLAFDDAENLSDPKRTDPDKRALLLAGNRRGAMVTLKELGPDKAWRTRYVNAFCPRLFSAIRLPDLILASRAIIIPLIRTADRARANADPLEYGLWPHDRRTLLDDLWAMALANLARMPEFDSWVGQHSRLAGRNLQPWRALLAVAAWLDKNGVGGLWERMETLSVDYQAERPELESSDFTVLVIRAMLERAVANVANRANVANHIETPQAWDFTTAEITQTANVLATESDGDIDPEKVTSQRLGHILKKMRLTKPPRPRGQKSRIWRITRAELVRWAISYGLPVPGELDPIEQAPLPDIGNIGKIGNIGNKEETAAVDPLLDGEL
jgi:hypothetical protein